MIERDEDNNCTLVIGDERAPIPEGTVILDGLDEAVLWVEENHLVYSDEKIIQVLMRDQQWSRLDALEWLTFNIHGLSGMEGGPYFVD